MAGFYERTQSEKFTKQSAKNAGDYNKSGKASSRKMDSGKKKNSSKKKGY